MGDKLRVSLLSVTVKIGSDLSCFFNSTFTFQPLTCSVSAVGWSRKEVFVVRQLFMFASLCKHQPILPLPGNNTVTNNCKTLVLELFDDSSN